MEHTKKLGRIAAAVMAVGSILSMQSAVTPAKVVVMVIGLAWLALGVIADG